MKRIVANLIVGLIAIAMFGLAGCGKGGEGATTNATPFAKAGSAQNVVFGTIVTLDGSGSSDANHDQLTYHWAFTSKPVGSNAVLSSANAAKPTFTPDLVGMYVLSLVVDDGTVKSAAVTVIVNATATNDVPLANAGTDREGIVGTVVTLDGSGSSDSNHDMLFYRWSLAAKPAGSIAELQSSAVVKPTFTPDVAGPYVFNLIVNDGTGGSAVASVTITAIVANIIPLANAGGAQSVVAGTLVTLDGSGSSDANHDPLTYRWEITSKPAGSLAALSSTTAVKPTFTAYDAGTYVVQLVVNDGRVDSVAAIVNITANLPETVVVMETTLGTIKIALHEAAAPLTTKNFLDYVNSGFYNNTIFHRVIPGFMVQGGGFTADLTQKPTNAAIKNEAANGLKNLRGTVAMARTSDVDSATDQFFINVVDNSFLDFVDTANYGYAVFGDVVEGMDVVDKIAAVATGSSGSMSDVPLVSVVITLITVQ